MRPTPWPWASMLCPSSDPCSSNRQPNPVHAMQCVCQTICSVSIPEGIPIKAFSDGLCLASAAKDPVACSIQQASGDFHLSGAFQAAWGIYVDLVAGMCSDGIYLSCSAVRHVGSHACLPDILASKLSSEKIL